MSELKSEYKKFYKTLSIEDKNSIPPEELEPIPTQENQSSNFAENAGKQVVSSPEDEYIRSIDKDIILNLLHKLIHIPERNKNIFLDHFSQDANFEELSIKYGLSKTAARKVIDNVVRSLIIELKIKAKLITPMTEGQRELARINLENRIKAAEGAKPKRQATIQENQRLQREYETPNKEKPSPLDKIRAFWKSLWTGNK